MDGESSREDACRLTSAERGGGGWLQGCFGLKLEICIWELRCVSGFREGGCCLLLEAYFA